MRHPIRVILALLLAFGAAHAQSGAPLAPETHPDVYPKVIHSVDPAFSDEAKAQHIEGKVLLYLIVDSEGKPTHVRVVKGLGYGLDEKAVEALRQFRFHPGKKDGRYVDVAMYIGVNFLHYPG
jgi:TonB family protein